MFTLLSYNTLIFKNSSSTKYTPEIEKDPTILLGLDYLSGAYRNRSDDLLTARKIRIFRHNSIRLSFTALQL